MKEPVPSQLIDKYLNGACSAEEEAQLLEWYSSFSRDSDPVSMLNDEQRERLRMKMLARIRETAYTTESSAAKHTRSFRRLYGYAAASIAAACLIVLQFFSQGNTEVSVPAKSKHETALVNFVNRTNLLNKHVLPDNSSVWLKPGATLSYNRAFIKREVTLRGEAFFEVEKDSAHPFLIHSGGVITRVIGTSFNVKALETNNTTEVSVVSGKVLVYTPASSKKKIKSVFLLPEQKVTYVKSQDQLLKVDMAREPALNMWKKNTLSFDNVPVSNVVRTLNRAFDCRITIAGGKIGHYTLRADFTDVNLPNIMELLSKSLNIAYHIQEDNEIRLYEKPEFNNQSNLTTD
ncbi:FecR family protein [Paradesertivirga mongoliensis]|uniref:FecR family protein n=1 Tax=Paradesertivirga mongoliensis TaxID=2100740 RepID=A0ABW4ZJ77_9SPHI|nr:FecR domain-containing protein [Pedobacter mongoliensis]